LVADQKGFEIIFLLNFFRLQLQLEPFKDGECSKDLENRWAQGFFGETAPSEQLLQIFDVGPQHQVAERDHPAVVSQRKQEWVLEENIGASTNMVEKQSRELWQRQGSWDMLLEHKVFHCKMGCRKRESLDHRILCSHPLSSSPYDVSYF